MALCSLTVVMCR